MNWKIYLITLLLVIIVYLIERYWYLIRLRAPKVKKKIYKFISVKKYTYSYKGIDVINVLPFTSYINGGYSFYKSSRPIVSTFEEAEKGFYQQLSLYHDEQLDWQIANKKWRNK